MSRFQDAINQMRQKREQTAELVGAFLEAESKLRTPVKNGQLKRSIGHQASHDNQKSTVKVGTNVEYAPYVEEGTKPHTINYNKPQHLKIDGVWVTVKKIHHPGSKAQPFLHPSITENESRLKQMIREGLS